jgi:hypothetical protein
MTSNGTLQVMSAMMSGSERAGDVSCGVNLAHGIDAIRPSQTRLYTSDT